MLNLFNSFGNNQSSFFGSMNFSDYASIRNGSYNKLLKAYYSKDSSVGSSSESSSTRKSGEKQIMHLYILLIHCSHLRIKIFEKSFLE